jgi:DNA-binding response OmpR family regulator
MGKKILAVDDEVLIQRTIERALTKVGFHVRTTSDPVGFLRAQSEDPADLLIVDLHIGGADMNETVRKALDISPRSKVLFISGSIPNIEDDPNFLEKPFRLEDLRARVRKILAEA